MRAWVRILTMVIAGAVSPGSAGVFEPVRAYTVINGSEIIGKLTGPDGARGDVERGRALYTGEARAGCAACHGVPGGDSDTAPAPDLTGIGGRLSIGALRLWIVAPEIFDPDTDMPAFYRAGQRQEAADPRYGGPALTGAEIEDLVAYLASVDTPK